MKHEKEVSVKSFIKTNAMQLLSLIMLSFATYITARLAPLSQDLAVVRSEVLAMQEDVNSLKNLQETRISKEEVYQKFSEYKDNSDTQFKEIKGQLQYIISLHVK